MNQYEFSDLLQNTLILIIEKFYFKTLIVPSNYYPNATLKQ